MDKIRNDPHFNSYLNKLYTGRELKALGIEFVKNLNEKENHIGVQYPLEGGWVEDFREFDDEQGKSCHRFGPGLYFCAKEDQYFWEIWGAFGLYNEAYWQRAVTFEDDEIIVCLHITGAFVFKAKKIHLGPRTRFISNSK